MPHSSRRPHEHMIRMPTKAAEFQCQAQSETEYQRLMREGDALLGCHFPGEALCHPLCSILLASVAFKRDSSSAHLAGIPEVLHRRFARPLHRQGRDSWSDELQSRRVMPVGMARCLSLGAGRPCCYADDFLVLRQSYPGLGLVANLPDTAEERVQERKKQNPGQKPRQKHTDSSWTRSAWTWASTCCSWGPRCPQVFPPYDARNDIYELAGCP